MSLRNHPRLQRLGKESGFALVLALGATIVLSAMVVVAIDYTSAGARWSYSGRARVSARALAEAGINDAASVLRHASDPTVPTLLNSGSATYDTGTVTWSGT